MFCSWIFNQNSDWQMACDVFMLLLPSALTSSNIQLDFGNSIWKEMTEVSKNNATDREPPISASAHDNYLQQFSSFKYV